MPSADAPVFVPAPDLPPGPRSALVIATSRYTDSRLSQLRSPVKDAEDLAAVLADPEIGGFKVTQLIDQTESRIRRDIAVFLHGRAAEETVLIYLSCHGIQDSRGRLLFAAADTQTQFPHASAVRAAELLDELDECKASRQILILDCCFSGSFGDSKGDLDLAQQLRGHSRGREVLTASRGFEYSYEGKPLDGAITGSVFTTGLVEGLRSGAADTSKDGHITVEEAYDYAFGYVQRDGSPQTPQRWLFSGEGSKIVLARSAAGREVTPARLPEQVAAALDSGSPHVRIGGVNAVAEWLSDPDPARSAAARQVLREISDNDIRRVAEVAGAHLERIRPAVQNAPAPRKPAMPVRVPANWVPRAEVRSLRAAVGAVTDIAFSPDGVLLAAGDSDGPGRVLNVATGAQVYTLLEGRDDTYSVAFSPDGLLLATGGRNGTVRVREASTGRSLRSLVKGGSRVNNVAFSPGGDLVAALNEDDTLRMWKAASGTQVRILTGQCSMNAGLAFSPDGVLLATGAEDGNVPLLNVATGERARVLECGSWAYAVAFSPDGRLLATGGGGGKVWLWRVQTGEQVRTLTGHPLAVAQLAFSQHNDLLASCGLDATVRVWNPATGEQVTQLDGHSGSVHSLAFSPTEPLLATASADGTVRLWR